MTTVITTIQSTDLITNSRTDINNNFSSLNSNKIETSYLDTDTSLTANSDSKIATQKAVKAYVDANIAGSTVSMSSSTTPSVVTASGQTLIIMAKGDLIGANAAPSINNDVVTLKINGSVVDTVKINAANGSTGNPARIPFSFLYAAVPGAQTNNITFASAGSYTFENLNTVTLIF